MSGKLHLAMRDHLFPLYGISCILYNALNIHLEAIHSNHVHIHLVQVFVHHKYHIHYLLDYHQYEVLDLYFFHNHCKPSNVLFHYNSKNNYVLLLSLLILFHNHIVANVLHFHHHQPTIHSYVLLLYLLLQLHILYIESNVRLHLHIIHHSKRVDRLVNLGIHLVLLDFVAVLTLDVHIHHNNRLHLHLYILFLHLLLSHNICNLQYVNPLLKIDIQNLDGYNMLHMHHNNTVQVLFQSNYDLHHSNQSNIHNSIYEYLDQHKLHLHHCHNNECHIHCNSHIHLQILNFLLLSLFQLSQSLVSLMKKLLKAFFFSFLLLLLFSFYYTSIPILTFLDK